MVLIAEVHHQHCIVHKDMKMLLGQAQESRRTLHVTQDTGRIGRALNEQSTGFQQQIKFTTQLKIGRSEEHTSELQSRQYLVCRLLLEKKSQPHIPSAY